MDSNTQKLNWRVAQFCTAFGIGKSKFYELVKAGKIKTVKLGHTTLIQAEEVERLQRSLSNGEGL